MAETYRVIYAELAMEQMEQKARYLIEQLEALATAQVWYQRLRAEIQQDLSFMPCKYPVWRKREPGSDSLRLKTYRNDVVLYSVDEEMRVVYIRAICTRGQDLASHAEDA